MGLLGEFYQKIVKNGRNGSIAEELDMIRSEYPIDLSVSGYFASLGRSQMVAVPSGKVFRLRTVIDDNDAANVLMFWDGPGVSVPVFRMHGAQSQTEFIMGLEGILFHSACIVSTLDSAGVIRVAGMILDA